MVDCTIAQNQAIGGSPGGHGVASIYNYGGSDTLLNTLVGTNSSATSDPPDVYGAFTSLGYNFIGNSTGSSGWDPVWDYQNSIPLNLGPLQDNGGPTRTCALLSDSLRIGGGTSVGALTTDQRGVPRPQNGAYDIGAVQTVSGSPFVTAGTLIKGSGYSFDAIFDLTNRYRIQASTNLTAWADLYTNTSSGVLHFTDTCKRRLKTVAGS